MPLPGGCAPGAPGHLRGSPSLAANGPAGCQSARPVSPCRGSKLSIGRGRRALLQPVALGMWVTCGGARRPSEPLAPPTCQALTLLGTSTRTIKGASQHRQAPLIGCLPLPLPGSPQQASQLALGELVPAGPQPVQPVYAGNADPACNGCHAVITQMPAPLARVPMPVPPHVANYLSTARHTARQGR